MSRTLRPIAADEARRILHEAVNVVGRETVPLAEAAGRVLADALVAGEDVPAFPRSVMDGYAVRGSIRVGYDGLRDSLDPVDRAAYRVFPTLGLLPVPQHDHRQFFIGLGSSDDYAKLSCQRRVHWQLPAFAHKETVLRRLFRR